MSKYEQFVKDARAFLSVALENRMDSGAIILNLAHDIYGLAANENFVPRVAGYSQEYKVEGASTEGVLTAIGYQGKTTRESIQNIRI